MIDVLKGLIAVGEQQGEITKVDTYDYGEFFMLNVKVLLKDGRNLHLEGRFDTKKEEE